MRPVIADLDRASETGTALAGQIQKEFGHLDVLINNAGAFDLTGGDGPASTVSIDAMKRTFATNFFGTVEFTQSFLPLLRAAESARILNVSSGLGSIGLNNDPASPFYAAKPLGYNASKAALNMFTVNLAWELRDTKIRVNSICPGFTATDLNNNTGTQTVEEGAIAIVRFAQQPDDSPTGGFFHKDGTYPWELAFRCSGCMANHEALTKAQKGHGFCFAPMLVNHNQAPSAFLESYQCHKGIHQGDPCVYIDLYGVQHEKIVEHWGFPEMVPPKEQWKNNNRAL